jgi:hypothetical protein
MLDLSHIPNSQQDVQIFNANGSAWQTWQKPRKCNYVWIMCIGGGGGGGGGNNNLIQVNSGGGSGAVTRALYNAQQLPDRLYVQVGTGGVGLTFGSPSTPGTRSFVSLQPVNNLAQNLVIASGNAAALGGSTDASGASRAGETAATPSTATFLTLSNFISTAGRASPAQATANVTPLTSQITSGGAVGGWANPAGNVLSSSLSPFISGGLNVSASGSNGGDGGNGITSWKPFFSTGGAGGGSSVSGSGGKGGDGGIGSGGGAGGSCASAGTPGVGGKGGDGLVVIISF